MQVSRSLWEQSISEQAIGTIPYDEDSIAIVELISLIEHEFGVRFTDEDLVPESFQNLEVISKLVAAKLEPSS